MVTWLSEGSLHAEGLAQQDPGTVEWGLRNQVLVHKMAVLILLCRGLHGFLLQGRK